MAKLWTANRLITTMLQNMLKEVEKSFSADCLCYIGPIAFGADDAIRDAVEEIDNKRDKLVVILETPGGFAETARRISDTLRHHYKVIDFLIPSHAMSAGTILAMSGDAIWMDYYSVLGPIDPQVEDEKGALIPALGYLIRYEKLLAKANRGKISTAELKILLSFDQGTLYSYEQARDLARTLLEEWLVKYKFKDWITTETRNKSVTLEMKKRLAKEIADKLNQVDKWNSHGIGINMARLKGDLNLKIDDFGEDKDRHQAVRKYYELLTDFMGRMGHRSLVQTRINYLRLK